MVFVTTRAFKTIAPGIVSVEPDTLEIRSILISAMKFAVPRLVQAIGRDLFRADFAIHEQQIRSYDTPEFPLVFARDAAAV